MTYLLDFLEQSRIERSYLFKYLNCNSHEALIIKKLLVAMLSDNTTDVVGFCEINFNISGAEIIPYLKEISNLVNLGFITSSKNLDMRSIDILSAINIINHNSDTYLSTTSYNLELSESFLQILQKKISEPYSPFARRKYENTTEYINDNMHLITSIIKCNNNNLFLNNPKIKELLQNDILNMQEIINYNLSISNAFYINTLFEQYDINKLSQMVFFTLAYNQINGITTQVRNLLPIGKDDNEKIEIQKLMSDDSIFLKNDFIYFNEFFSKQIYIDREICITNKIFNKIMNIEYEVSLEKELTDNDLFDFINPDVDFNHIILDSDIKERLEVIIKHANPSIHLKLKQWGIKKNDEIDSKILFYGDSGTGKTMSAYAIAKSLNKKILSLDCSKILSMYVGESEKNVRRIFDEYKDLESISDEKPILLLDEADQLLSTRGNSFNGTARMYNQMQNIFLAQIEKFNGIIIATTNLLENLDSAFSRRFHYKIKFNRPSVVQREKIWDIHLPEALYIKNRSGLISELAKFDLSGGQIKIVVLNVAYKVALKENTEFDVKDFIEEVEKEINGDFSTDKKLGFQI